jgi:anti-sigma factor RsiW
MSRLSDDERAELVAYLDQELSESEARAVEARLTTDPALRAEAESLQRAWGLLDMLPRAEPSPTFSHKTIERLTLEGAGRATGRVLSSRRRWLWGLGWAAAVLLVAGAGFVIGGRLAPTRSTAPPQDSAEVESKLARHPRVIQNMQLYDHVEDLDMLKALGQPDLFGDEDSEGSSR